MRGSARCSRPQWRTSRKATRSPSWATAAARVEALRLVLMPKEPARGPNRTRINPGPNTWNQDTALGLTVESSFVAAQGKPLYGALWNSFFAAEQEMESADDFARDKDGNAVAHCSLANPLPVSVGVDCQCVVRGHYLEQAGRDAARIALAPHSRHARRSVQAHRRQSGVFHPRHAQGRQPARPARAGPGLAGDGFDPLLPRPAAPGFLDQSLRIRRLSPRELPPPGRRPSRPDGPLRRLGQR